jgi:hypothetical protein
MAAIALVVIMLLAAFAYTRGWLSPQRLTLAKIVDSLAAIRWSGARARIRESKNWIIVEGRISSVLRTWVSMPF